MSRQHRTRPRDRVATGVLALAGAGAVWGASGTWRLVAPPTDRVVGYAEAGDGQLRVRATALPAEAPVQVESVGAAGAVVWSAPVVTRRGGHVVARLAVQSFNHPSGLTVVVDGQPEAAPAVGRAAGVRRPIGTAGKAWGPR